MVAGWVLSEGGGQEPWGLEPLGLQRTKAVPFPSGSFSPLPLPPQYNTISFPLFKFGVPFHIPFGIDVAGGTGFFGGAHLPRWPLSMVLRHQRLGEPNPSPSPPFTGILETPFPLLPVVSF